MAKRRHLCPLCGYYDRSITEVISHVLVAHEGFLSVDETYNCMCGGEFPLSDQLSDHWRGLSSDERGVHLMLHRLAGGK